MKRCRTLLTSCLVVFGTLIFNGCATTNPDSSSSFQSSNESTSVFEKNPSSPTNDMNCLELIGYFIGWIALEAAYAYADGNPAYSPTP